MALHVTVRGFREATQLHRFPCSLVLLRRNADGEEHLVGHVRIVPVTNVEQSVYIEDVYIARELRGQGNGRELMKQMEEFCKKKGMCHCFLGTTPDISKMYVKFGYHYCDWRIQTIGSGMLGNSTPLLFDEPLPGWECFYRQPVSPPVTMVTQSFSYSETQVPVSPPLNNNHPQTLMGSFLSSEVLENENNSKSDKLDKEAIYVPFDSSLRQEHLDSDGLPPIWSFEEFERSTSTYCWLQKDV
ncbi:uncharacterized protein [Amphiura filiformis]|uniref:uncharacterized protein n=1 Tax=Amphiura filiformis TaxID=82378 RepID=UPI003B20C3BD